MEGGFLPGGSSGGTSTPYGTPTGNNSSVVQPILWTEELHQDFLQAVEKCGGPYVARPKNIKGFMRSTSITTTQIKSHLQRHRQRLRPRQAAEEGMYEPGLLQRAHGSLTFIERDITAPEYFQGSLEMAAEQWPNKRARPADQPGANFASIQALLLQHGGPRQQLQQQPLAPQAPPPPPPQQQQQQTWWGARPRWGEATGPSGGLPSEGQPSTTTDTAGSAGADPGRTAAGGPAAGRERQAQAADPSAAGPCAPALASLLAGLLNPSGRTHQATATTLRQGMPRPPAASAGASAPSSASVQPLSQPSQQQQQQEEEGGHQQSREWEFVQGTAALAMQQYEVHREIAEHMQALQSLHARLDTLSAQTLQLVLRYREQRAEHALEGGGPASSSVPHAVPAARHFQPALNSQPAFPAREPDTAAPKHQQTQLQQGPPLLPPPSPQQQEAQQEEQGGQKPSALLGPSAQLLEALMPALQQALAQVDAQQELQALAAALGVQVPPPPPRVGPLPVRPGDLPPQSVQQGGARRATPPHRHRSFPGEQVVQSFAELPGIVDEGRSPASRGLAEREGEGAFFHGMSVIAPQPQPPTMQPSPTHNRQEEAAAAYGMQAGPVATAAWREGGGEGGGASGQLQAGATPAVGA